MNADDLAKVKEAMGVRSDERWRTPSGAFLGLLRQFAKEEKIAEIADACQMYVSKYRGSQYFVASALPAIILNHYKPLTRGVTFDKFLKWSDQKADWSGQLHDHASSTRLASVIDDMKTSIEQF